jgi:hypothetical protein
MDQPGILIDRGNLHGRNLVPAEALAHQITSTREWSIAKRPFVRPQGRADRSNERLLRIREFGLRPGQRRRNRANRFTGAVDARPPG